MTFSRARTSRDFLNKVSVKNTSHLCNRFLVRRCRQVRKNLVGGTAWRKILSETRLIGTTSRLLLPPCLVAAVDVADCSGVRYSPDRLVSALTVCDPSLVLAVLVRPAASSRLLVEYILDHTGWRGVSEGPQPLGLPMQCAWFSPLGA